MLQAVSKKSPGEIATKEAIRNAKPMSVREYAVAQRTYRATVKRLRENKPPRVIGYHSVNPRMEYGGRVWSLGSFGDVDYG